MKKKLWEREALDEYVLWAHKGAQVLHNFSKHATLKMIAQAHKVCFQWNGIISAGNRVYWTCVDTNLVSGKINKEFKPNFKGLAQGQNLYLTVQI